VDPQRCPECGAGLAADQRWCLGCGARTARARPELLAALLAPGDAPAEPARSERRPALPSPRAAATAILLVLGFGCAIGTTVAPDAVSRPRATVVVMATPPAAAPATTPAPAEPAPEPAPAAAEPAPSAAEPAPAVAEPTPTTPAPSATTPPPAAQEPAAPEPKVPPLTHVAVIALTGQSYAQAFAPDSPAAFIARELPARGALLRDYESVAGSGLANEVALLSGQPSNWATELGCPTVDEVTPPTLDSHGVANGAGCRYPDAVPTLPGELASVGRTWKAYLEQGSCAPGPGEQRDAFPLFHSLDADCTQHVVPLGQLDADLASTDPEALPNLMWIVPAPSPDGLPAADAFARAWSEKLLAAPAMKSGLLVVLFDAAQTPDLHRTGAVLVSRFIRPGTVVDDRHDHLDLLRTLAETFGVPAPGQAASDEVAPFGRDVFSAWKSTGR
jgi:phosphatidylinositol-3-phosphatase